MIGRIPAALLRDSRGASAVEFALVAPVLLTMLFGLFDACHNMYTAQMLQGAIQKAARDSTIEGAVANVAQVDAMVTKAVKAISPAATVSFTRKSYSTFTSVSRAEDYSDLNSSGTCDNGEAFEDANKNGTWDTDVGNTGFGSARDAVLYTVTVSYDRLFPIAALIPGQTKAYTMSATNVLRNQPYGATGAKMAPGTGNCA